MFKHKQTAELHQGNCSRVFCQLEELKDGQRETFKCPHFQGHSDFFSKSSPKIQRLNKKQGKFGRRDFSLSD